MSHKYNNPVISALDDIASELEKTGNADLASLVDEVAAEVLIPAKRVGARRSHIASSGEGQKTIYHISGWDILADVAESETFVLRPGTQHAEGPGIYFSQDRPPQGTTAEGTRVKTVAVIALRVSSAAGWWRTKPSLARKFNRPMTWHSDGKSIKCKVDGKSSIEVEGVGLVPLLTCSWEFV